MTNDTLSNMLSSLKNASMVRRPSVEIAYSKEKEAVAKVLEKSGFIAGMKTFKPKEKSYKMLHLDLAYDENEMPKITKIKRVSKPGRRVYKSGDKIGRAMGIFGVTVISTSRGVMTGDEARKRKLGGEVICEVS